MTANMPTETEKGLIRRHWAHLSLRFMDDGSVRAQQKDGGPWTRLYTRQELEVHVMDLRRWNVRKENTI